MNTYELRDSSMAQRMVLAGIVGGFVAAAWWMLLGSGIGIAGEWFGRIWTPGDPSRRDCLAVALSIYYIRLLFTEFVFLKRGVIWSEALTVAAWISCIYLLLTISGGTNSRVMGVATGVGVSLFVVGSWMNSYAEYTRHMWKRQPENRKRLYTLGLFRYSRHPNYLGDLISFSGLCLISGSWITVIIPAIMLVGFVFASIPMLDSHLRERYGLEFEEYARRTRKLIPFVY
jgi:protein-S-isoprenylcysteine O-methyltransferase Ste14